MILFQCLGITGVILMFYGLLAFAFTQVSTVFFWGLVAVGAMMTAAFVVTSLSRQWQATVVAFVALNLPWVFLVAGKGWPVMWLGIGGGGCAIALYVVGMKRSSQGLLIAAVLALAGSFAALLVFRERPWFTYGVLGAVFLYNVLGVLLSRMFLKDLFRSRSLQYSTSAAVYTAIALSILVLANILSNDKHFEWDFTDEKINQLTDQSTKVLGNLKQPLQVILFLDDRNPKKQGVKDILRMYEQSSKNVKLLFLDADRDKQVATEYGAKDGDIAVNYGGKKAVTQDFSEQGITQTILKAVRTSSPTICFTTGHGELEIDGRDDDPRSLSGAKLGLKNEGYVPKAIGAIRGEVPSDCSVVVVAGPIQSFTSDEAKGISMYLEAGGKAAFLIDPNVPDPRIATGTYGVLPTGLEDTLSKWGVELGRNFILEKHLELLRGMQIGLTVIANTYGSHAIVDPLKEKHTVFQNVRSVRKNPNAPATAVEIISSAGDETSWAESDVATLFRKGQAKPDAGDARGPVPIAVALEKTRPTSGEGEKAPPSTKIVVIGDADFISNALIQSYEFNFDLFLNTLNWLQGEVEQISIRPKKLRASAIELTTEQANTLFYVAIIGLPMVVLIFGLDLWWWRRRRG